MNLEVKPKNARKLLKTPLVQQTSFWSEVKRKQGLVSRAFDIKTQQSELFSSRDSNELIYDDIHLLIHSAAKNASIAYVPYGPFIEPSEENQGAFLEELSECLRPHLPDNCMMIRYDLHWQSHWAKEESHFDGNGIWKGLPEKRNQEFRFNFNTKEWNLRKANTDVLPSSTIFLDIDEHESDMLERMKPKTRYNIRLAARKGVIVRKAGIGEIGIWYDLYKETCLRNNIFLHDLKFFTSVLQAKAEDTESPARIELLIAEHDGIPTAAMFLAVSKNRGTYLYGASSAAKRNLMSTYALQWHAILSSKKKGCTTYDMFGVSPDPDPSHPMYGLYKFKKGFGGRMFHRMGCWDYPLKKDRYEVYAANELTEQGYHLS